MELCNSFSLGLFTWRRRGIMRRCMSRRSVPYCSSSRVQRRYSDLSLELFTSFQPRRYIILNLFLKPVTTGECCNRKFITLMLRKMASLLSYTGVGLPNICCLLLVWSMKYKVLASPRMMTREVTLSNLVVMFCTSFRRKTTMD